MMHFLKWKRCIHELKDFLESNQFGDIKREYREVEFDFSIEFGGYLWVVGALLGVVLGSHKCFNDLEGLFYVLDFISESGVSYFGSYFLASYPRRLWVVYSYWVFQLILELVLLRVSRSLEGFLVEILLSPFLFM